MAQAPPAGAGGRGSGGRGAVSVWAVVPAYNEEERVGFTVEALYRSVGCRRVIVVDDGSTDGTAERASRAGATVLRQGRNRGKGQALRRGIEEVVAGEDRALEAVLLADADLGPSAGGLGPLVEAVRGGADLAVASFSPAGGFGIAKRLAAGGIRALTGRALESPLSGQRALSPRALSLAAGLPRGWGVEVAMTVRALAEGLTVVEVPLALEHRRTGRDLAGFVHRGKQCGAVAATLLGLALERLLPRRAGWAR